MDAVPVIEPSSSGRARCRACGERIERGELRLGERVPNPFGEGEATYWFHLICAACRRPEAMAAALATTETAIQDHHRLAELAAEGRVHHRLPRISRVERDRSGRARCRGCRERIARGSWRVVLEIWEEGRFGPIGFVHLTCAGAYFGTSDLLFRICHSTPALADEDVAQIDGILRSTSPPGGSGAPGTPFTGL